MSQFDIRLLAELERLITQMGGQVPVTPQIANDDERYIQLLRAVSDRFPALGAASSSVVISASAPADTTKLWLKEPSRQLFVYEPGAVNRWLSAAEYQTTFHYPTLSINTVAGLNNRFVAAWPFSQVFATQFAGFAIVGGPTLTTSWTVRLRPVAAPDNSSWSTGSEFFNTIYQPTQFNTSSRYLQFWHLVNQVVIPAGVTAEISGRAVEMSLESSQSSQIQALQAILNYRQIG